MGILGPGRVAVAVAAPGAGPGFWAGASSAAFAPDGELVIAYRLRTPDQRGAGIVIARSDDGERLTTIATLDKESFGAESLERPALVHTGGGWRLYISCATPGTKHWRIDVLESRDPEGLAAAASRTVFPGSHTVGVKDPVVRRVDGRWRAWICCHPLDVHGEEDRMTTALATSDDGLDWTWRGVVLAGRPGTWDARGARVTAVLSDGTAYYDGRATKEENFSERTGLALPAGDALSAHDDEPVAAVRYIDIVASPSGERLAYYERPRQDGSHELCVERLTR
ncbi:MAG TPA: hypothetical protein VFL29_09365 [Candidatus Dormibacteraeota bacterium]|nr:hypothetical protein [Candidatus Dormibacteraeota bacterium]